MKNPNGPSREEVDYWNDAITEKEAPSPFAWRTWHIKAVYSHGETKVIAQTVKARTKEEAETKAFPLMEGRCLGYIVYLP